MTLLTEEEAEKKWCPQARSASTDGANRYGNSPDMYCFCLASACMAWRWESYRKPEDRGGDKRGYCGAFGIPMESIV